MSAVEYANRESQGSWREFLLQLKARGLNGVQFVVSGDHPREGGNPGSISRRVVAALLRSLSAQRR